MRRLMLAALLPLIAAAAPAAAQVVHVGAPAAAIASATVVPPGYTTVYVSGQTPPVLNASAPAGTAPDFGDTKTQRLGIM